MDCDGLAIHRRTRCDRLVLELRGELDSLNARTVAAELRSALDTFVGDVDIDLDGVQFVDLAGAQLLLELSRGMDGARHRRVALVRPTPMFDRIVGLLRAVDADERCA
jgi:anti-anti-sigma factor